MNDFENSTTTQIENLSLHELIEYELKAIESGYKLLNKRPIFSDRYTRKLKDIESLTNVVDLSAEIRSFNLKETERNDLFPLLYLAGFKVLDMIIEVLLEINQTQERVNFETKQKRLKKIKENNFGMDKKTIEWVAKLQKQACYTRNPAIHKKIEFQRHLKSFEDSIRFLEAVYWLANLKSENPTKKARAIFETRLNAQDQILTASEPKKSKERKFEIILNETALPETLELRNNIRSKLEPLFKNTNFDFYIVC